MKAVYLTYEGSGPGGQVTIGKLVCKHLNAQPVIVSSCSPRPQFRERRRQKFESIWGPGVKIAIGSDEIVEACRDADVVFLGLATWKATHKNAEAELQKTLQRIGAFKVLMCLGSNEFRIAGLRKLYASCSGMFDCWWSERPAIRDFVHETGKVSKTTPYVVGCNVYTLSNDGGFDVSLKKEIISAARFSSMKKSHATVSALALCSSNGIDVSAWGWSKKEASMYFMAQVKNVPEVWANWNSLLDSGSIKGEYSHNDVQHILKRARYSVDNTLSKGDASRWGDGGLQYCQAEAIDWGTVPVVNRGFYMGDEWDTIVHRVEDPSELLSLYRNWSADRHTEMIEAGREYIKKNLSLERFQASINEVLSLRCVRSAEVRASKMTVA